MKKLLSLTSSILLVCILLSSALMLSGCSTSVNCGKIKIVCTMFPQYDWMKNIISGSDNVELYLLIRNGADPHSYQPTASDIMSISNCDILIFTGGDSENWVKEALKRAKNENLTQIVLTNIDGMTLHDISSSSHSHEHEHEHEEEHTHSVFDEHIWLSIHNAITAVSYLTDALCKMDSANAQTYQINSQNYISSLTALDAEYKSAIEATPEENRFMLFADRFPFVYLLSDYNVEYQAAFEGCTADADADFETIITLIKEANEHSVKYIAITEGSDGALAATVANSTERKDIEIITLNSLQNVNEKQIENGTSYISAMKENLAAVKVALSK